MVGRPAQERPRAQGGGGRDVSARSAAPQEPAMRRRRQRCGCGSKPMGSHFGVVGELPNFCGDWDVHWGCRILTHGHVTCAVFLCCSDTTRKSPRCNTRKPWVRMDQLSGLQSRGTSSCQAQHPTTNIVGWYHEDCAITKEFGDEGGRAVIGSWRAH